MACLQTFTVIVAGAAGNIFRGGAKHAGEWWQPPFTFLVTCLLLQAPPPAHSDNEAGGGEELPKVFNGKTKPVCFDTPKTTLSYYEQLTGKINVIFLC